ncbi:MAG: transporter [Thermoleophilia bacterium]|nr:transporter [Thermoleophilia bacterium]
MAETLAENPLLLLFACLAVGSALGAIRLHGFSLGPAAVLFTALAFSAWDDRLELPHELGSLGLAIFAYCVGVAGGPSFFGALRHHLTTIATVVGGLAGCGVVTHVVAGWLGIPPGVAAGTYAGALTNTPALAAATDQLSGRSGPTVGYSVTYVGGVVLMLGVAAWALRSPNPAPDDDAAPLVSRTIRVTAEGLPTLGTLTDASSSRVVFSRVRHRDDAEEVARDDMVVMPGDLVTTVGREQDVDAVVQRMGNPAEVEITLDRRMVDMRRVALSNRKLSGLTVEQLDLARFGARATRVRRGDVDLVATRGTRLHLGDRIRIIAPRHRIPEVSQFLGDSERGPGDLNPLGLSLGMAAGILLGLVAIPIGGGELSLGLAAGPLVVGLLVGRLARTGPIVWSLPYTASHLLQQLGILIFLAAAGSRSGGDLVAAIEGGQAPKIALLGIIVTAMACLMLVAISKIFRMQGPHLAGFVAGTQTQPAVLAFAQERTGNDNRVAMGYALVFPAAMVAKIVVAIILAGFALK